MKENNRLQAVFLDRDGTIGGDDTIHYPGEFTLFAGVKENISKLQEKGIKVFAFTNQPGIAKGLTTKTAFMDELLSFGFDQVYICPHAPEEGCKCRKPNTEMLQQAADEYKLSLARTVVIGDRWSDMIAASKVGARKILVKTGAGEQTLNEHWECQRH